MTSAFNEHWVNGFGNVYTEQPLKELSWFTGTVSPALMQLVIDGVIPRGASVIDVGCGPGVHTAFLAQHGMRVTGVDISPAALAVAGRLLSMYGMTDIDLIEADVQEMPLPDAQADVVHDSFVFHNVRPERRNNYAAEVARVLRPDGLLVLVGFSDRMTPGTGPLRLTSDDLLTSFLPHFTVEELRRFRNLPTEKRPDQWHWLAVFRRR
jgi:ubiquinone/menaquinone biosynthesis C-methylase UbiE